jgi:hypothetical protein
MSSLKSRQQLSPLRKILVGVTLAFGALYALFFIVVTLLVLMAY